MNRNVGSPHVATENTSNHNTKHNICLPPQDGFVAVATCGDPTLATHHANRLGNIVGAIKADVTRFARRNDIEFNWQSRFHDHIIRGTHDGNRITEYIENNAARWDSDCFNDHYIDTETSINHD